MLPSFRLINLIKAVERIKKKIDWQKTLADKKKEESCKRRNHV